MVIADIEQTLLDNAGFEAAGSVAMAQAFLTAATQWLILRPESASNQSSSLTMGKGAVERLAARARVIVSSGGGVRFLSVREGFR